MKKKKKKMTIEQAIKTVESIINSNKELIEREKADNDFAVFLKQQNRALEILLEYVKGQLN